MIKLVATLFSLMTLVAFADAQLEIKSVEAKQRDMQSGIVDMTVTLQGDAEAVAKCVCTFAATNVEDGAIVPVAHITCIGNDTHTGNEWTRRFVWNAPADVGTVKIEDVALSVVAKVPQDGVQLWNGGPYWAEFNIGATKPEDYGYYFWWGDTVGYEREGDSWNAIDGSKTDFSFNGVNCPTDGKGIAELSSEGYTDASGNLVKKFDAATVHLGAPWRMPTEAEFLALIDNCTSKWITKNGVCGLILVGKGAYSANSIFLPASGYGGAEVLKCLGTYGHYWSSTPYLADNGMASFLEFNSIKLGLGYGSRYAGLPVRPVQDANSASAEGPTTHLRLDCRNSVSLIKVEAQQRNSRDGLVDVTVTLQGEVDEVANALCAFTATNTGTGAEILVSHITRNGEDSHIGNVWTRRFVWDAAADVGTEKIDGVALTVVAEILLGGVQLWENGPYWAECNVGATKPEECGYYFWWGDTVGCKRAGDRWEAVDGSNPDFSFSPENCPTDEDPYGKPHILSDGYIDSTRNLVSEYDSATSHLGTPWRMPVETEVDALIRNCTTTWTTCNGVNGLLVMGKDAYAVRSIFLPAVGQSGYDYTNIVSVGSHGYYWSASAPPTVNFGGSLFFNFGSVGSIGGWGCGRWIGMSVRPVRNCAPASIKVGVVRTNLALDCRKDMTFYVDGEIGSDSNSGEYISMPFKTIQAAVDVAQDGDTILVAAGTYAPFASKNKSVVIQSASDAAATLIDGTDALRPRVEMLDDTDSTFISVNNKTNTVLVGFTVEHCELIIGGTIQRCVIRDIDASAGGAPINFSIVDNSLILNNVGCNGGAGDNCIFRNCTIVGNRATSWYSCVALNCVLENCIVYGNADNSSGTWQQWLRPMISDVGYREATVFRDNPLFVNAEGGDYRLSKNSPCIDAGDNLYVTSEMDLNGLDRVVNDRVDVGCCEYQHPIVEDGLVAWYKFDGNARDSSGNGNDGVSCGAQLTADRAGNANGAYLFQGADWIQIDSSVSLNSVQDTDEMSFAAWLRIDSYDTWVPIFCKATGADGDPLYDFKYTFGRYFEGCDADLIDLNSVPKVGDWAHVAVTINHGEIVIYQNGNEVGRGSGGAFNSTIPNDALCIGMDSVTYKEFLRGAMDDVRFYNRALTESEVRALYDGNPVVVTHLLEVVSQDGSATTNVVPNGAIVRMIAPDNIVDMDGRRQIAALGSSFTAPIVTDHFDVLVTNDMTVAWDILSTNFFFEVLEPINGTISAPTNGWKRSGCVCEATAMPEDHYHFTRWVGDIDGAVFDDLHIEMIMDRPRAIGAEFAINTYTVSFELGDKGRFTVESRRKHLQSQTVSAGSGAIEPGVEPFYGWSFVGWDKNFSCVKDNMVVNAVWRDIRLKETIDGVTWIYTVDDGVAKIGNNGESAVLNCTGETVAVPTSLGGHPVVGISTGAFDGCNSLAHITIPRHIKSIGDGAFKNCGNLSLVFFEDADCELGRNVFSGCGQLREMQIKSDKLLKVSSQSLAGLDGVTICVQSLSAGFTIPVGHASGGSWAGANNVNWCVGPCIESGVAYFVGSIYSNRVGSVVTYPGAGPFGSIYRMTPLANIEKIDIPSTIAGIGVVGIDSDACDSCESIHEIGVSRRVRSIGTGAFRHCGNLMSITVEEDNEDYFAMDGLLYGNARHFPEGPELICCPQGRVNVVLPNGLVSIGRQAFQNCKKIVTLHIPNTVEEIEERAFDDCISLEELSFSSPKEGRLRIGRTLFGIDWLVLRDLKLRRIEFASIIPPAIESDALLGVVGVEIDVSVFAEGYPVGVSTWAGAGDVRWNVVGLSSPGIDYFETQDGMITNVAIDYATLPERIEIPEKCLDVVTSSISSNVFKGAFLDCHDDRRFGAERFVSIPKGVNNIGAYAFANCSGLVGVEVQSATCNIDVNAFDGSYNITSIMIPSYLMADGSSYRTLTMEQLFRTRSVYRNITNIVISAGSTRIASRMFAGCENVSSIFLSKEIEEIGMQAFARCGLKSIMVEFGDVNRVRQLLLESGFDVDAVTFEEIMTAKGLKDVFGDASALSQHIKTEQDAEAIGDFLVKCGVKSAGSLTDAQKRWSYESYVLSSITAAPELFEEEPTLKIEDIELSGGNLSLTISLTVGTEKITLVKERLAEKIRVGSTLGSISEKPDIRAYPSADGTSLTFTIIPPSGSQGFVRVQID